MDEIIDIVLLPPEENDSEINQTVENEKEE